MLRNYSNKNIAFLGVLAVTLLGLLPNAAWADFPDSFNSSMTGTLTISNGGLSTESGGAWSNATLTYKATRLANSFRYEYWINLGTTPSLSHSIIETSNPTNLISVMLNGSSASYEGPKLNLPKQGNPGLPQTLFGVKIASGSVTNYIKIESTNVPMWGSAYFKGSGTYLYNVGLPTELTDTQRYDYTGTIDVNGEDKYLYSRYVLVPDTQQVPLPGAMILGSLGLGAAGYGLKRKKKTA